MENFLTKRAFLGAFPSFCSKDSLTAFLSGKFSSIQSIVVPSDNCGLTLDHIKDKDCPSGKTVYTVDKSAIPTDRSFRNAWTYTE